MLIRACIPYSSNILFCELRFTAIDVAILSRLPLFQQHFYFRATIHSDRCCYMVDLLVFASSETTDKTYGFYIDAAEVAKTKSEVYFWVDGEEVTYTTKEVGTASKAYELAEITAKTSKVEMTKVTTFVTAEVATGAAIKGNTLVVDGDEDNSYALDKNVIVYVYDESDKELSVSTTAKLANVAKTYKIYLYDMDAVEEATKADNTYEIVVFTQK